MLPALTMTRGKRSFRHAGLRDRLRRVRREQELNFSELARLSDVSRVTIRNIEDERVTPVLDIVEKLADALGVSPAWIAYGVRPQDPAEIEED